ncbi:S9 family peptidase [Actinoalloteichus hymeniacidonis]|uniref:Dipeptidyl aminopeptidase/acylaminoacyl peptidase n=1 Tax=Actinoalloteichus hymeniacidonis TaxID=340345 RepID=A0AAC9HNL1_9PSEU|nr:S9 family peptidase [Actinoalloteichus hymeniacidonis]AOS62546.1 dipeptidyl aminopeptidase/acylaminoacyl peptidase [Actinoalloteichus hymeniacidonis]MBB5909423.1 dipeptidyl aminopeptidase/acylaminoacyl peptidase [Actinoalloteichus hymeniacidonis]
MTPSPTSEPGLETDPPGTADNAAGTTPDPGAEAAESFRDLDRFTAMPRLSGLALSRTGDRLVTVVSELAADGKTWQGALWEIDPTGAQPAHRLTRSNRGESSPVFTPDGSLLFVSTRADQETSNATGTKASLWSLPPTGEARQVFAPAGGVAKAWVAATTGRVVTAVSALPFVGFGEPDETKRKAREDAGVTAILHESYPVRFWDHDIGPSHTRLLVSDGVDARTGRIVDPLDVTPESAGRIGLPAAISPDGSLVAHSLEVDVSAAVGRRDSVVVLDSMTGSRRCVFDQEDASLHVVAFDADSTSLFCLRHQESTAQTPPRITLVRAELASGEITDLLSEFPLRPTEVVLARDGRAVFFSADADGRKPVFRLDLAGGEIERLTAEGAYTDLQAGDDGVLFALRSSIDHPAEPVRIDTTQRDQDPLRLPAPGAVPEVPGRLTEIETTVADGRTVRAWLALPTDADAANPAPLLLWVHGGPMSSWNSWTWRWNPWTATARGYAVLLPDPALSTGYGEDFIDVGWRRWGTAPFTDLMSITDVAVDLPEVDAQRTAAMGGSFGGYMANWIAGNTDRFDAIVTHASLWHTDQFSGTTDNGYFWQRALGDPLTEPEVVAANSPHLRVADIRTPMLVIHGDRDYRVPIGEALRMYHDLTRHGVPARFLYFPTENHWILTPGNAKVWYETVFSFLAERLLGEPWRRPELL